MRETKLIMQVLGAATQHRGRSTTGVALAKLFRRVLFALDQRKPRDPASLFRLHPIRVINVPRPWGLPTPLPRSPPWCHHPRASQRPRIGPRTPEVLTIISIITTTATTPASQGEFHLSGFADSDSASPFPTPILSSHGYGGQVQHAPPTQNMYPSQTAGSYQGSTGTLPGQAMNYLGRGAQSSQADSQYGSGFPATGFPQSWSSQTSSEKSSREQIQWAGYQPGHDQRGQNRSRQDRRGQYPLDQYQLDQYQPEQYQGRRIQSGQYPTSQIESSQKKQAWYWNSEKQIYEPYNG